MTKLTLPFYYHEMVELFWKGDILGLLPKDCDPRTLQKLRQKVSKQLTDAEKNQTLRFLLGVNDWKQYCRQAANNLPKQDLLSKQLGKLKLGIDQLIELIDILNVLIDYGNVKGFWVFPLILSVEKIPQIKNPIGTDEDWQQTLFCSQLVQLLSTNGYPEIEKIDGDTKLGMLTLSLLLDSYVINQKHLLSVLQKLESQKNFHYHNGRLFFLVPADDFNPPRKIYLSKKTESLIYQAEIKIRLPINANEQVLKKHIKDAVRSYLKHIQIPYSNLPKTLEKWCQMVFKYLHLSLPPVIVNYLTGITQSHALNTAATGRILNVDMSGYEDITTNTNAAINRSEVKRNTSYSLKLIQKTFDVKVKNRDALKIQSSISEEAKKHLPTLPNNYALIMQWGLSMLEVGRNKTLKVGPAQILASIYAIGRHLVGLANQKNIQSLTLIQRAELYEAVMDEAISSRNLETIQYHLRSFNTWLEKHFLLFPLPNKADFFGDPKLTDMTVNANVIHFDEYEHIKNTINELCHKEPYNTTFTMMRLALFLGFRCGMRSKEVFQLKLEDFIFCEYAPQIAIRESAGREIKTPNAKRFFKLRKLMPEDEIQYLKDWFSSQTNIASQIPVKSEDENSECFFFSTAQTLDKPVVIDKIKSPLMKMVREVCQDDSLNFHHLRHSFASWHFLSACNAELDLNIENEFNQFPATQKWLMKAQQRKLEHLPTHLKSKKYAFWLLKNMGHGGFSTTFEHYIHVADIVVNALLNQKELSYTIDEIAEFSGLSISTLKKQKDRMNYVIARSIKPYKSLKLGREVSLKENQTWQPPKIDLTTIRPNIRDLPIYQMMEVYHLSSEDSVSLSDPVFDYLRFDKSAIARIREIFKLNPKYRIRRLRLKEEVELQYLIHKLEDVYSISLESLEPTTELSSVTNTFMNWFYPMNSDRESLSVQKHLHLVMSDRTSATILVNFIQRLELPFQLILRHSKKWSVKELNQTIRQWRKELALTSKNRFEPKIDNNKKIGPRARVEILVQNSKGKRNQAFYYLMIMLSAWLELSQKIA